MVVLVSSRHASVVLSAENCHDAETLVTIVVTMYEMPAGCRTAPLEVVFKSLDSTSQEGDESAIIRPFMFHRYNFSRSVRMKKTLPSLHLSMSIPLHHSIYP